MFQERWRISGTLTTVTPLRIGSGKSTKEVYKDVLKADNEPIQVDEVILDAQGKPYIPATALKGNLRNWLKNHLIAEHLLETVFGSENQDQQAVGGKTSFFDAQLSQPLEKPSFPTSYWKPQRQTGVAVGVTIDRITRTALEKHLFHREIVPPQVSFAVRILAQGLTPEEIAILLAGLEGFNAPQHPVTLGSDTAQHQGRLKWQLQQIEKIDESSAKAWLEQDSIEMGYQAFKVLEPLECQSFYQLIPQLVMKQSTHAVLRLDFKLIFDSPFLVNDPALYQKDKTPDHQPKQDQCGNAVLPARSMRGAVRSQAERIIRTLGGKTGFLDKPAKVGSGDLAAQLFGSTDWKTPIEISDFTLAETTPTTLCQEFVAVDRFTGGGGEGLKFNAKSVYKPIFTGYWQIDLERVEPWGLGLLALVIRDLCEGDITFGFGASKGYGRCHASLTDWSVNQIDKISEKFGLTDTDKKCLLARDNELVKLLINCFLADFRSQTEVKTP